MALKLKKEATASEEGVGPEITIDVNGTARGNLCLKTGDCVEIIRENDNTIMRKK